MFEQIQIMTQQHYTAIADTKREQRQRELTRPSASQIYEIGERYNQHKKECAVCSNPDVKLCPAGRLILLDIFT